MQVHNANTGGTIEAQADTDTGVPGTRTVMIDPSGDIYIKIVNDHGWVDIKINRWNDIGVYDNYDGEVKGREVLAVEELRSMIKASG